MDAYYLALCVDKSGAGVTTNEIVDSESDALESDRGDNIAGDDGEADGGEAGRVDERCLEEHLVASDENFFWRRQAHRWWWRCRTCPPTHQLR